MNLQEKRKELGIEQADLAEKIGTNAPMMSNFEHHKCLPVPMMLKAICRELNCDILDIYNPEEIYVAKTKRKGSSDEKSCYRLTSELPDRARYTFSSENLKKCGFKNLRDFIWQCWKWLEKKQSQINKKTTKHSDCSVVDENDIFQNTSH